MHGTMNIKLPVVLLGIKLHPSYAVYFQEIINRPSIHSTLKMAPSI